MTGKLDIVEFSRFFSGNTDAYGIHVYDKVNTKGEKRSGSSRTESSPLSDKQYIEHLSGKQGLGVIPINRFNKCRFAVIDIDEYKVSFRKYFKIIENYGIPLCLFRSKSGGLHMYVFFDQEYAAKDVVEIMKKMLIVLGLKNDTEIFPKQTKLQKNGFGNWINLPYYDESVPEQYLYDENEKALSLSAALRRIKDQVVTIEELKDIVASIPFADAPPCLQTLYIMNDFTKDSGNRNDFLMQVASYLKNKYADDFPRKLVEVNERFPDSIGEKELNGTVIQSHQRKTYAYGCKNPLLANHCNREVCKLREYGLQSLEAPNISYGQMIQYVGLSTRYTWEIDEKILEFDNEDEILSQQVFLKVCIRNLKVFPYRLSLKRWDRVIREAVGEMETKKDQEEFSNEVLFSDYLNKFLNEGAKARNREQIGLHRVFEDPKINCFVFRRVDLIDFLETRRFTRLKPKEIKDILIKLDGKDQRYHIGNNKYIRCWLLPIHKVNEHINIDEIKDEDMTEDFSQFTETGENEY